MPREALEHFSARVSSRGSVLVIVPWASERPPEEHLEDAARWAAGLELVCMPHASRDEDPSAWLSCCLALVSSAHGFFFTGGDQNRIMDVLDTQPELHSAFAAQFSAGLAFGGTSAGAAVMSGCMITGEGAADTEEGAAPWSYLAAGRVGARRGLGLAPAGLVVDQHFTRRARFNRLVSVLLDAPAEHCGLGIDEDMAVIIHGGAELRVLSAKPGLCAVLVERQRPAGPGMPSHFALALLPANTGHAFPMPQHKE
jgi:cyanophycinase